MDDLVERLRAWTRSGVLHRDAEDAIDRIEAQAAEIRSLRAQVAQERAVVQVQAWQDEWHKAERSHWGDQIGWHTAFEIARRLDAIERHEDKEKRA